MPELTRALVVGATGNLGTKIVRELRALGAHVRAAHRAGAKAERLAALAGLGAELCVADVSEAASLDAACEGVEVVVSALQGLREIIVDGQARLFEAAARAGAARFLPSDYSLDFFKTEVGGNRNLDLRRELNAQIDASGSKVRATSVLNGAFMDLLQWGAMGPDAKTGIYKVWGDPDQRYDFTHTDDLAKYIAAAALDRSAPRVLRVAGDSLSPRELAAVFTEVRGLAVTIESAGSLADLDALIARMRASEPAPDDTFPIWQRLQYARDMAGGRGKLDPLDNDRYPTIRPTKVRELLRPAR